MTITEIVTRKPKVKIDTVTKQKLAEKTSEESQVIIHCSYSGSRFWSCIRIWKSTFLITKNARHRSKLIHAENISMYPVWTNVGSNEVKRFTLFFKPLPKDCELFDLVEIIPEPDGFKLENIARNKADVYFINLK